MQHPQVRQLKKSNRHSLPTDKPKSNPASQVQSKKLSLGGFSWDREYRRERVSFAPFSVRHDRIEKSSIACALGTIIPDSTHHISVGSLDKSFRLRILPRAQWFVHPWRCACIQSASYPFLSFLFSGWFWFDCTETHGNGNYSDVVMQNGLSERISLRKRARRSRSPMRKRVRGERLKNGSAC